MKWGSEASSVTDKIIIIIDFWGITIIIIVNIICDSKFYLILFDAKSSMWINPETQTQTNTQTSTQTSTQTQASTHTQTHTQAHTHTHTHTNTHTHTATTK